MNRILDVFVIIIFLLLIAFTSFLLGSISDIYTPEEILDMEYELERNWEKCKMYGEDAKPNINGLYFIDSEYYCVWTKGRGIEEINNTEYHEACHALIYREPEHFCGDVCEYELNKEDDVNKKLI